MPVLGAESKLPEEELCLKMIFAARAPPGIEVELLLEEVLSLSSLVAACASAPVADAVVDVPAPEGEVEEGERERELALGRHPDNIRLMAQAAGKIDELKVDKLEPNF